MNFGSGFMSKRCHPGDELDASMGPQKEDEMLVLRIW